MLIFFLNLIDISGDICTTCGENQISDYISAFIVLAFLLIATLLVRRKKRLTLNNK